MYMCVVCVCVCDQDQRWTFLSQGSEYFYTIKCKFMRCIATNKLCSLSAQMEMYDCMSIVYGMTAHVCEFMLQLNNFSQDLFVFKGFYAFVGV